jgi:hypothetical protein
MRPILGVFCLLAGCQQAAPPHALPAQEPFCTRTLGTPECYPANSPLPNHPTRLGDTPVRTPPPPTPWWKKITDHWQD